MKVPADFFEYPNCETVKVAYVRVFVSNFHYAFFKSSLKLTCMNEYQLKKEKKTGSIFFPKK